MYCLLGTHGTFSECNTTLCIIRCIGIFSNSAFFPAEGDAVFITKLQDYTAVEKEEVVLDCELSKDVPVKWFHNEIEIKASKLVVFKVEGKRRILNIKKVEQKDKGVYACDCGTDKTSANVNIEGDVSDRSPVNCGHA